MIFESTYTSFTQLANTSLKIIELDSKMPHATATFNGKVIAETDTWEDVEGNVYVKNERTGWYLAAVLTKHSSRLAL